MNKNIIIDIKNLKASIENKAILKDLNLKVKKKEVHVIMGPNGSGKSTLSKILAGHPSYEINAGEILFDSQNLLEMTPEVRSHEGLFLAFQYPIEIPGVTNYDFLILKNKNYSIRK
jgi:Fe-S cluster assembly ATP-binding protein